MLTGRTKWYDLSTQLLKKRAVLADTTEELIQNVQDYLQNNNYPADLHNREFFSGYGGTTNVNEVKNNALRALQEVIS